MLGRSGGFVLLGFSSLGYFFPPVDVVTVVPLAGPTLSREANVLARKPVSLFVLCVVGASGAVSVGQWYLVLASTLGPVSPGATAWEMALRRRAVHWHVSVNGKATPTIVGVTFAAMRTWTPSLRRTNRVTQRKALL